MPSISLDPPSGRYLSFAEREEIAVLTAQECGVREIARRLGRDSSTISRERRRNAATRCGRLDYRASVAQWHADRQTRRPKTAKLAANEALQQYVQDRLAGTVTAPNGSEIPGPPVMHSHDHMTDQTRSPTGTPQDQRQSPITDSPEDSVDRGLSVPGFPPGVGLIGAPN